MQNARLEQHTGAQQPPTWITVAEATIAMTLSEPTVRRLIRAKALRICRIGRRVLIHREAAEAFMLAGGTANARGSSWRA